MRVVVALNANEPTEPVRKKLLGLGLECSPADCVSHADLPVRLAKGNADLVLVGVGADPVTARQALRQASGLTRTPLLAIGPTTDGPGIIDALQSGAREYLDAERLETTLEAALQKIRSADTDAVGGCRVVSFLSATGGCGVTTAATNVAVCWARKDPGRVALAELGGGAATLALNLDIEPRFGTAEVTTAWERMDASFLRQSLTAHGSGVQVLAQKVETVAAGDFEPAAARKMVLLLRTMAAAVALDLGHRFGPEHFEAMRLSDRLALVVRLEVPALRQARSLLQTLEREGVPRTRVALIANRYGQRGQLPWKKAEEALGTPFLEYLPEDVGGMNHALNHGKPLVQAGGGSLARRFSRLADKLTQA